MSAPTWQNDETPDIPAPSLTGWTRVLLRGAPLAVLVFGCLILLLLLRLIERPIHGLSRPWTPHITVFVCRNAFRLLGIDYRADGVPMSVQTGAMVANHASWLDIFTLNAAGPVYFVSKSEVSGWPGIGWLARATGTLFIVRDRKHAQAQTALFEERLRAGHKLLFFPEGTSTDGLRVLGFKTTLFAAFFSQALQDGAAIQPVSVVYYPPSGAPDAFYGWWGDMSFGTHLLHTLAAKRQGGVRVLYHTPLNVADFPDRKALAAACEAKVREGHAALQQQGLQ